jgi:HSP20 family molecular chaperone IbpA
MLTEKTYNKSSIYPGEYEPPLGSGENLTGELQSLQLKIENSTIQINDLAVQYGLEIPVPGFKREDFAIDSHGRLLTIVASKDTMFKAENTCTMEDLNNYLDVRPEPIRSTIQLPDDTDPAFAAAEYRNGILNIFFSKGNYADKNEKNRIVVY